MLNPVAELKTEKILLYNIGRCPEAVMLWELLRLGDWV